jgi:peptidoglycan/LPS O-acetylase OafA/YrhL
MGNDQIFPLNGPSWTLFFEMLANIYYAVFIRSLTTRHLVTIMFVSALGLILGLYLGHTHSLGIGWTLKGLPFGLFRVGYSFFAGILLYRVFRSRHLGLPYSDQAPFVPLLLLAIVAALLTSVPPSTVVPYFEFLTVTVVFPAVIYTALSFEPRGLTARVFSFLGGISYAVYAIHSPLADAIKDYFTNVRGISVQAYAPYGGMVLISSLIALCWILDKTYDAPVRKRLLVRFN